MFSQVSVILSTGGSPENPPWTRQTTPPPPPPGPRRTPPGPRRTSLGPRRTPPDQGEPPGTKENPPRTRTKENPPTKESPPTPPGPRRTPPGRRLQHTVNERPVRILLECILVLYKTGYQNGSLLVVFSRIALPSESVDIRKCSQETHRSTLDKILMISFWKTKQTSKSKNVHQIIIFCH